jgi:hypothetical protein
MWLIQFWSLSGPSNLAWTGLIHNTLWVGTPKMMIGRCALPVHEYLLCLGTHRSSRKECILRTKGAEPNNNDVCRIVGLLRHRRVNPPWISPNFPGPDPEKTGVGLIFDQLG